MSIITGTVVVCGLWFVAIALTAAAVVVVVVVGFFFVAGAVVVCLVSAAVAFTVAGDFAVAVVVAAIVVDIVVVTVNFPFFQFHRFFNLFPCHHIHSPRTSAAPPPPSH